jgi:hypothetical protein
MGAVGQRGGGRIAGSRRRLRAVVQQQLHRLTPDVSRRSDNQEHDKPPSFVRHRFHRTLSYA